MKNINEDKNRELCLKIGKLTIIKMAVLLQLLMNFNDSKVFLYVWTWKISPKISMEEEISRLSNNFEEKLVESCSIRYQNSL